MRILSITAISVSFISLAFSVANRSHIEKDERMIDQGLDREQVVEVIKEVLDSNPEVIISSLEKYQNKKMQEAIEEQKKIVRENRTALEDNSNDPRVGSSNPKVKVVEFFDYNCGYCKKMSEFHSMLLKDFNDVQFIYKELPIMSQSSAKMSRAAIAVSILAPEKYIDYQKMLLATEHELSDEELIAMANKLGIDTQQYISMLNSKKVSTVIEDNIALAQKLNIRGTPFYVINGEMVRGADQDAIKKQIDLARSGKTFEEAAPVTTSPSH